ncbi:hypothetical protein TSUD_89070 [Trifolium subterraneum]|uniref:Uncharacterized protein n=1 Tax=Trifolium subterraneum TaxID=3900 RepID=A0A2Z6NSM5_TRISU|nr:hypothetical protein TSUD_89070 [Trifolium subterraneum]
MKFGRTDLFSILQDVKRQENRINLKKRWFMGLPIKKVERKKLKEIRKTKRYLPESLLRKDDLFYEEARTHVEHAFGAPYVEGENCIPQDEMDLIQIPNLKGLILSCLDNLTTKGLYLLAMIVNGDAVKYERTRGNLKKIIKGSLSSVLTSERHDDQQQLETHKQLFQLLNNPQHFQHRCELLPGSGSQFYRVAVVKVLCGLEKIPSQTLIAMRRKLKGIKAPMPQLKPLKHGFQRSHLIQLVDKLCRKMLSQLDERNENEQQSPLAKAISVADLSQKLIIGFGSKFLEEFYQFSPEVKSLQSDIINAIWSVGKKEVVPLPVLRDLQLLIEPKTTIANKSLRTVFVNLLTEFLFECCDMDNTPKSLLQVLDVIGKCSNKIIHDVTFQKKHIEEEVDHILSVSAQTNQIVQELLPDCQFDQDFTDAYMEQSDESDDSESDSDKDEDDSQISENRQFQNGAVNTTDSNYEGESVGDFMPFEFHPSTSMTEENILNSPVTPGERLNGDSEKLEPKNCNNQWQEETIEQLSTPMAGKNYNSDVVSPDKETGENIVNRHEFYESYTKVDPKDESNFCEETKPIPTKHSAHKNQYLATQDACDKTAMLAYNLIGHMLEEFAVTEGLNLDLIKRSYLNRDKQIEEAKETKEQSSSRKRKRVPGPAIVGAIEELIPSFPESSMERLKILMDLR